MIDMLIALWDLLRSSFVCLVKGIVGLVMVAAVVVIPILIAGAIWEAFCIIFVFEFSWWIPIVVLVLAIYFIATGEEE
jgi:hypothetical protein